MLAPPKPKPEYEVVAEGAGLFILIFGVILVILAFIVFPEQSASYLSNMVLSFVNWAWDIISGISTLVWSFIQGIPHMITGAVSGAGNWIYNHTIGAL